MPDGCRFPVSVCIAASASAMNTTSRPIGSWTFGLSGLCPLIQNALFRRRRRPQRDTRDHLYPTNRCEAGDAGPDLGRGQNDIERPAAGHSRISGVELTVAKADLS